MSEQFTIGYLRVSTDDQATNGHGLAAQRAAIQADADRRGWRVEYVEDAASGKDTRRPELDDGLARLDAGKANALVVAKLDLLSRTVVDFAQLVEHAQQGGWSLVVLDPALDLTTPAGRLLANILSSLSQREREMISQRTREGLQAARANGQQLGRPAGSRAAPDVERRIVREREAGASLRAIAGGLNADGVPTALGGREWYPATVGGVVKRLAHELSGPLPPAGAWLKR
jgi:DNA invertase Pin-like site-specific DNA recombinase